MYYILSSYSIVGSTWSSAEEYRAGSRGSLGDPAEICSRQLALLVCCCGGSVRSVGGCSKQGLTRVWLSQIHGDGRLLRRCCLKVGPGRLYLLSQLLPEQKRLVRSDRTVDLFFNPARCLKPFPHCQKSPDFVQKVPSLALISKVQMNLTIISTLELYFPQNFWYLCNSETGHIY